LKQRSGRRRAIIPNETSSVILRRGAIHLVNEPREHRSDSEDQGQRADAEETKNWRKRNIHPFCSDSEASARGFGDESLEFVKGTETPGRGKPPNFVPAGRRNSAPRELPFWSSCSTALEVPGGVSENLGENGASTPMGTSATHSGRRVFPQDGQQRCCRHRCCLSL
jgi:hypothetical protein